MDKIIYCDNCKEPAIRATRDLIQVESDSEWADWEPRGNWRYGCNKHPPQKAIRYGLNGKPIATSFIETAALLAVPDKYK